MVIDLPTPDEFQTAAVNLLYLAWETALTTIVDFDEASWFGHEPDQPETEDYWKAVQPALANSFSLIQQAMEMSLKGRIAAVSPFLLLTRDPRDWPKGVDKKDVTFSEFRTVDASDLVKVHNAVASERLTEEFQTFWDDVRKERNAIIHSVSKKSYEPHRVISTVLQTAQFLFSEKTWAEHRFAMDEQGKFAALGVGVDDTYNVVMRDIDAAVRHLTSSQAKSLLGFDKKRRAYVCPNCWGRANRDWQDEWPKLAQLASKSPKETKLLCVVCSEATEVERSDCNQVDCKGNVIAEDMCLTCMSHQSD